MENFVYILGIYWNISENNQWRIKFQYNSHNEACTCCIYDVTNKRAPKSFILQVPLHIFGTCSHIWSNVHIHFGNLFAFFEQRSPIFWEFFSCFFSDPHLHFANLFALLENISSTIRKSTRTPLRNTILELPDIMSWSTATQNRRVVEYLLCTCVWVYIYIIADSIILLPRSNYFYLHCPAAAVYDT